MTESNLNLNRKALERIFATSKLIIVESSSFDTIMRDYSVIENIKKVIFAKKWRMTESYTQPAICR